METDPRTEANAGSVSFAVANLEAPDRTANPWVLMLLEGAAEIAADATPSQVGPAALQLVEAAAEIKRLAKLADAVPGLLIALEQAAVWFSEYVSLHHKKGTPDGDDKAQANRIKAAMLRTVIADVCGSEPTLLVGNDIVGAELGQAQRSDQSPSPKPSHHMDKT